MDLDPGMAVRAAPAAARRVERLEPMAQTKAERLQRALCRTFGRNVLRLRQRLDLSQQQLGDMANLSPNYVGQAERGVANVTLDVVARLAACLGTTPSELLSDNR
jgi:ribosome-binding protein aMBF1 (putative translation factor)